MVRRDAATRSMTSRAFASMRVEMLSRGDLVSVIGVSIESIGDTRQRSQQRTGCWTQFRRDLGMRWPCPRSTLGAGGRFGGRVSSRCWAGSSLVRIRNTHRHWLR